MKGIDIIDKARNDLKEFIFFEAVMILLAKKSKFEGDDDIELSFEDDLETVDVVIPVEDNSLTTYEIIPLKKIRLTIDKNIFFVMGVIDDEIEWTSINTDDLVKISCVLERKYNELKK